MSQSLFFVSGITGHVGGATMRHLLEKGHKVRALVRDPQKATEWEQKGVELHQGDLNDSTALATAMQGVDGAFLMQPPTPSPSPDFSEAKANIVSFTEALKQAPPLRLVALSSVGSQQSSGLGNITATHLLEEALGSQPFPTAFVRAGSFFENFINSLDVAEKTGVFYSFLQPTDRAFPMVATDDIGKEIAHLLTSEWSGKRIIELGSRISPDELSGAMSEVLGREVTAQAIPRDQWAKTLESIGMPPGTTSSFEEMEAGFNSGWIDFGIPGTEPVAGTTIPTQVFAEARKA
ncbi:NAD-dependent epimerase/dehydratase family protein [bacterium]|nr:MAG: NAD-dependent epimerase/dehydratase family protein [bacterium]